MLRLTRMGVLGLLNSLGVGPTPPPVITTPTAWWNFEGEGEDGHWISEGDASAYLVNGGGTVAEPGLVGNCAHFPGTSIDLHTPTELAILGPTGSDDWSLAIWHRSDALPPAFFENFLGTFSTDAGTFFLSIIVFASGNVRVNVGTAESGAVQLNFTGAEGVGEWHFFTVRYTQSDNKVYASLDGGSEISDTLPLGPITVQHDYSWIFGGGPFSDSKSVDSCGWWQTHSITPDEISYLYNGGAGRSYP